MSLTGNQDVDNVIVSFCECETLVTLLSINNAYIRKLIYQSADDIIKYRKDYIAQLIIELLDRKEVMLAKQFAVKSDIFNSKFDEDYEILFCNCMSGDYYREDVLMIYFSIENINYERPLDRFLDDGLSYDSVIFYLILEHFYNAAINIKNILILKRLIKIWDAEMTAYSYDETPEEYPGELIIIVNKIKLLNERAKQLCL